MNAVRASETSVYDNSTRRYIPEGSHLHNGRCQNLKSHKIDLFLIVLFRRYGQKALSHMMLYCDKLPSHDNCIY